MKKTLDPIADKYSSEKELEFGLKGTLNETGDPVLISSFKFNNEDMEIVKTKLNELQYIGSTSNPLLASVYEVLTTEDMIFVISEYQSTNLKTYIQYHGHVTEETAKALIAELVLAIKAFHRTTGSPIKTMTAENILLDQNCNIRLATHCSKTTEDHCYWSPELLIGKKCSSETDVWSMGILLYYIVTGRVPFQATTGSRLADVIISDQIHFPLSFSNELSDLLEKMLTRNCSQRITLEGMMCHKWFSDVDFSSLAEYSEPMIATEFNNVKDAIHSRMVLDNHISDLYQRIYNSCSKAISQKTTRRLGSYGRSCFSYSRDNIFNSYSYRVQF